MPRGLCGAKCTHVRMRARTNFPAGLPCDAACQRRTERLAAHHAPADAVHHRQPGAREAGVGVAGPRRRQLILCNWTRGGGPFTVCQHEETNPPPACASPTGQHPAPSPAHPQPHSGSASPGVAGMAVEGSVQPPGPPTGHQHAGTSPLTTPVAGVGHTRNTNSHLHPGPTCRLPAAAGGTRPPHLPGPHRPHQCPNTHLPHLPPNICFDAPVARQQQQVVLCDHQAAGRPALHVAWVVGGLRQWGLHP